MKEFEKWLKNIEEKEGCEWLYCQEDSAELAWKAALEWALKTRPMNHFGTAKANCIQVNTVEQELENE